MLSPPTEENHGYMGLRLPEIPAAQSKAIELTFAITPKRNVISLEEKALPYMF